MWHVMANHGNAPPPHNSSLGPVSGNPDNDDDHKDTGGQQLEAGAEHRPSLVPLTNAPPSGDGEGGQEKRQTNQVDQRPSLVPLFPDPDLETPVHDQLPSVEEVRTTIAARAKPSKTPSMTRLCLGWLVALAITGLIVGLSVGLTLGVKGGNDSSGDSNDSADEGTNRPADWPDGDDYNPVERFVDATAFLLPFSTEVDIFSDVDGPQYKAAHWLAASDMQRLPIPKRGASDYDAKKFLQRYALTVLYYALGGDGWKNDLRFLSDEDECGWYRFGWDSVSRKFYKVGAVCEANDPGVVKSVWVPNNNAQGTIPPEINLLDQLGYFSLVGNNITSTIPSTIGALSELWYLELDRNSIGGEIPASIGDLEKLQVLGLSNNDLEGNLPNAMSNMASLILLSLDDNNLEGSFTPILNLESLRYVYLENNFFDGTIRGQIFNDLTKLVHLDVSDNFLEGTVPANLFDFPNLTVLDFHDNDLATLPTDIPMQNNLEFLAIQDNLFEGQLPDYFGNLRGLSHLDLSINIFSGSIPTTIGKLSKLRYLFLGENNFGEDPMPQFLQNMTNLEELSLKDSRVTGNIPTWMGMLTGLRLLDLDGNNLVGEIPDELESLVNLRALLLNQNDLNGSLPTSLTKLTDLALLLVDNNSLEGDMNFICENLNELSYVSSDCGGLTPEVNCTNPECCNLCCDDAIGSCNNLAWRGNYDPRWEDSYERQKYVFELEIDNTTDSVNDLGNVAEFP